MIGFSASSFPPIMDCLFVVADGGSGTGDGATLSCGAMGSRMRRTCHAGVEASAPRDGRF